MRTQEKGAGISNIDVRIGIGLIVYLLIAQICPDYIQALAGCTAVIMCTQDNTKFSLKSGMTRLLGVLIGGVCGTMVVLLDEIISNGHVFSLLVGVFVIVNLLCCRLVKMPNIVARVSCITFVLDVLVADGVFRIKYALLRLLGTLIGAAVAMGLAWIYERLTEKVRKNLNTTNAVGDNILR